ncbi:molybdate ABC transporter permease subunit [Jannaschia aquimarina]|uniref:Molybdenum transport system permease n=1 Tax=Jannaschia aquimarina TaxID=935700 RepID=A0A0D1D2U8_9RHOB|nr:molybdate ABC transporter permease subunit [Jannaschia aquimarina]KIT14418.1 Molybdenum transport system permease protein ModB [Jannaschia aquimarina]SNT29663.1 molybdate transport system permease protein [Jannaschia aquimarina]
MIDLPPEAWEAVRLSLRVSAVAVAVAFPLALLTAHLLARGRFPGRGALDAVVHLPLVLPPVVTGYALLLVFAPSAPLGAVFEAAGLPLAFRWTGAALAAGVMAFPLMVRPMRLALEAVDPGLEEAAATLGLSRLAIWRRVTLPLIAPGILAGVTLGFAKAFGEFGATITFAASIPGETRTLPAAIYAFLQVPGGEGQVVGLVALAVAVSLSAVILSDVVARRLAARLR